MVSRRDQRCVFRAVCIGAAQVYLAGDFNGWSPTSMPMRRIAPDLWQVSLRLPPGEYRFRYVTDDHRWFTDFRASGVVRNGFGEWDSLLRVPEQMPPPAPPAPAPSRRAKVTRRIDSHRRRPACVI